MLYSVGLAGAEDGGSSAPAWGQKDDTAWVLAAEASALQVMIGLFSCCSILQFFRQYKGSGLQLRQWISVPPGPAPCLQIVATECFMAAASHSPAEGTNT